MLWVCQKGHSKSTWEGLSQMRTSYQWHENKLPMAPAGLRWNFYMVFPEDEQEGGLVQRPTAGWSLRRGRLGRQTSERLPVGLHSCFLDPLPEDKQKHPPCWREEPSQQEHAQQTQPSSLTSAGRGRGSEKEEIWFSSACAHTCSS